MKRHLAAVAALALPLLPVAALADDTTEVFWSLPDGGTPSRVTWPQTYSPNGAVQCGTWYQVDRYPTSKIPGLIADGLLHHGEDFGIALSWRFVFGGDCEPTPTPTPTPSPEPTSEPSAEPTTVPTTEPTTEPTTSPTEEPTTEPTETPATEPTEQPTTAPTTEPTEVPTTEPTEEPTSTPTTEPAPHLPQVTGSVPTALGPPIAVTAPTSAPTTEPTTEATTTTTLAATGADVSPWRAAGALGLIGVGVGLIVAARKRGAK